MDRSQGHGNRRNAWRCIALVAAALGVAGCATARMRPPLDLVELNDEFAATERSGWTGLFANESFVLGPYRVTDVDRDWKRTSGGILAKKQVKSGYTFQFREGEEALAGKCTHATRMPTFKVGPFSMDSPPQTLLVCHCGTGDSTAKMEMKTEGYALEGRLKLTRGEFDVTPLHERDTGGPDWDAAGYRVGVVDGPPLGGVEVIKPGRIWLSKAIDAGERRKLGCLLAGLMLFQEPKPDSEDD